MWVKGWTGVKKGLVLKVTGIAELGYIRIDRGVDGESQPLGVDKMGQKWQKVNL